MNPNIGDSRDKTSRKSLDEIASLMAENTMQMRGMKTDEPPNEVTPEDATPAPKQEADQADQVDEQPDEDTQDGDDTVEQQDTAADDDASEAEPDAEEVEPSEEGGENDDFDMEIGDDTVFQLDDETEVSFKDLKQLYTADKDTLELIETQRTATQEALTTRQKAIEEGEKAREAASAVFEHFDRLISTPIWGKPDESLKQSNPQEYIQRLDYYQQDQERIQQQRNDLSAAFDQHLQSQEEIKQSLRQQTIQMLSEKIPALKSSDEKVKQRASQDILTAAKHYGFKDEEVNSALDYRLYQMAYDAQQYRNIMDKSKTSTTDDVEEKKTRVKNQTRTLRSRGTTANQRLSAQAKRVKVAQSQAKKSGKVDDVAEFIAAKRQR